MTCPDAEPWPRGPLTMAARALVAALAAAAAAGLAGPAAAQTDQPPSSPDVIEQRVRDAIAAFERDGFTETCAAISDPAGPFLIDQAYVFIFATGGQLVCHPRPDLLNLPTGDRSYVPDMMRNAVGAAPEGAWTVYLWPHPNTYEVADKSTYCQISGPVMICAGAHFDAVS